MDITNANMEGLFKAFNVKFTAAMRAAAERVTERDIILTELAMLLPSTTKLNEHDWINQIPGMREWIGPRVARTLDFGQLIISNRDFEQTVDVPMNAIEDDQYNLYGPRFEMMGDAAGRLWMELAVAALVANNNWADGKPFFAKNRKLKDAQVSSITNATIDAFSEAAVKVAIAAMRGYMLAADAPAQVSPKYILVGPALEDAAIAMCERELTDNGKGTTVSNTMKGRLTVRISDLLVGEHANKWFVLGSKNTLLPVAVQQRKLPILTAKDKPTDDNVFDTNTAKYGTHARGAAFLVMPFLAYAGGLGSVPDAAASGGAPEGGGGEG